MRGDEMLARISLGPGVMVGKPVIRGTRLTVEYIPNLLGNGAGIEEILDEYKDLTSADIHACLLFAALSLEDTDFMPGVVESA